MTAWKDLERQVCRALGGERSGPLGRENSDCVDTDWAVECKRSKRTMMKQDWLDQAKRQGKEEGKPWVLVVRRHNEEPYAILAFSEFAALTRAREEKFDA